MLNAAQIHLALNHVPLFGVLVGAAVLIAGSFLRAEAVKKTGLVLLVLAGVSVVPVYLSGESTEEIVEHKPGISEAVIEAHEESAELSLVLTIATALAAGLVLVSSKLNKPGLEKTAGMAVVAISLIAFVVMARTAHLGGLIRHPELGGTISED